MKNPSKRLPRYALDERQQPVVYVPLSDGSRAVVDASAYERLREGGVSPQWTAASDGNGRSYVRCRHRGRMQTVARLIMSAPQSTLIRYGNGDRRDLRMSNLKIIQKRASKHAL